MSRVTKWKLEKTKVKVVFRLQFHATHIPQSGWDKLFISFVPSDSVKATAKTTKANVRNGTCKWADPIYETTRLLQDARSKQYDEKLYKLVVAMGSSRASILGEAIINLADYADASKPSSVSLPLHGCSSGTTLHVTVQLLTSKTGFREFEQQRELREGALQSDENGLSDKVNAKVRFKNVKELSSVEEESGPHEEYADSSNTSESMYAEKPDSSSGHEIDSLKSTMSGDLNGLLRGQSPPAEKGETSDYQVHGWNSDYSVDNDLPVVYEENHKLRESLELAQSTISELQGEIKSLQSQANEIGSGMHELQHLVAAEVSSGEEMAKDVSFFRSECSKLKDEIERLRNLKINSQVHTPNDQLASATELDLDLSLPESLLRHLRIPPLVSPETDAMKNKMFEMMREMDEAKFERESLIRKMHQMECYYEALIQELDDNQKRLLGELQNLRNTISSNNAEAESVRQDMGQQLLQLSREREDLDIINKELERRAAISEASLRRARLNYSIAVDKLQKDLELLSSQVVSMFETNENIIKQAFPESTATLLQNQQQNTGIRKHQLGGDNLLEDLKESLFSQEALYQKVDEELREMQFSNLHLDIFSKTLEEILQEADVYIGQMKWKSDELARSLDFTKVANDQLTMRLQSAMEEIQALNDMALEKQTLECNLETVEKENNLLVQQVLEFEGTIKASCEEKDELSNLLKQENEVNARLQFELSILEEELETSRRKISELASLKESLDIVLTEKVSDLEGNQRKYEDCCAEKAELSSLWKQGNLENAMLQNEILVLKEEFESAMQNMTSKLDISNSLTRKLQFNLESVANKFSASFEVVDKNAEQIEELLADLGIFGVELEEIAWKTGFIDQEIMELKIILEELERNKSSIGDLERERENISVYLQDKDEELHVERTTRENIEGSVRDLTSQLEEYRTKMAVLEAEYLELQKTHNVVEARLHDSLVCEACCREESFVITIILREALVEKHDAYENICFKLEEHQKKIADLEVDYMELQERNREIEARLHDSIESETSCREENEELLMTLKSLRCDLEASVAEHNAKIEEYHKNMAVLEAEYVDLHKKYNEAEAEILFLSKEELEIMMIILKDKFVEQHGSIASSDKKLEMLQSRCDEVTLKLSEQILKTEEFKNLSLHFKELKDKAEAEKREPDGPPVIQESLRMAFVKEQYETRLQELRQQLSISRKHGEEMLFKLQDAIDEIENRKKSESLLSKRNEELSGKLLALEADMKSVLFDSCEKNKAYDEIKAKLECSVLSLECCKEEKNKIAVELARTKEQLGEVTSCNTVEQEQPGSSLDVMNLRSSMEHLQEELERMKIENSVLSKDEEININPDLHVLQAEIVQLHKVNEQLRNMFPLLDEIASSGNALERVLALEIELAESLRATNKSNIHFQSSFLKQHSDEAAVLKSFRDINELIREMLELKGKYGAMESELKEMHDRYSELSLQLAEVEGDRQKLKMTLKNVRPSRKLTPFNRSP